MRRTRFLFKISFLMLLGIIYGGSAAAQSNQTIFADGLLNGWQNWSWATVNLANTSPVHAGTKSISVSAGPWQALYFHNSAFDPATVTNFSFWIHGGSSGGQQLVLQAILNPSAVAAGTNLPVLAANTWKQFTIPMSALVPAGQAQIDGFWIQDRTGGTQPTFYVDDVQLAIVPSPLVDTNIVVDAAANVQWICPEIYGVAFATSNQLSDLNLPLNRSGGNATTRYNWQLNAANHGADWYFESISSDSGDTAGLDGDNFISDSKAAAAQAMLTIPTIGWVAKLGANRAKLAGFSIAKYGAQTDNDSQWFADAGNGISTASGNPFITGNDPNDANLPANTNFQAGWIGHLTNRWGTAIHGGLRYYLLDNEPSLWHSTHRDVHPVGATMAEVMTNAANYARMIKAIDPSALIAAPEEWGWSGYFFSGYDQQWGAAHGWSGYPDRATNGGWDYLPWFLDQMRQKSAAVSRRLLDVFTVHYYPQGGEFSTDVSTATQLLRNRSTRSLWDTNYTDESWIADKVKLIPRLKAWVATNYPGTRVGITEYSWGADTHINGATAQADVLGILGREGVDLATRWTVPATASPAYNAFKIYRNYDGHQSTFGQLGVSAVAPNPDNLALFAAMRTNDGALTIMVINKVLIGPTPFVATVTNFIGNGSAQVWQLTAANVISNLPSVTVAGNRLTNTLPAQSITLFVLPPATPFSLRPGTNAPPDQLEFWLDGQAGQSYLLFASTNLATWQPVSTNTLSSNSFRYLVSKTNATVTFYRGRLNPP
jgi:hypothetical protein